MPRFRQRDYRAALKFTAADATNQVSFPHISAYTFGNVVSVSFWAKADSLQADAEIIGKQGVATGYPFTFRYNNSIGRVSFGAYDLTFNPTTPSNTALLPKDGLVHFVGTRDGVRLKLYRNRVLIADIADTTVATTDNTGAIVVGNRGGSAKWFDGSVLGLRIMAETLDQAGVDKLYYQDIGPVTVLNARLDDSHPTVAKDRSPNANHGTITGATWTGSTKFKARRKIQNFSTAVRLNGTSSFFMKTTPTGINVGTGSRTLLARIYLTGATENALGCLCQFKRSLVNQSPGFLIGVLGGVYYVGFDTINPTNNLTITEAQFKAFFRMRRWLDVAYVMTTTTLSIYVNRVLVTVKTWGVPINTLALSQIYFGKSTVATDSDAYFLAMLVKEMLVVNGACTVEEIEEWSLNGVRPANVASGFKINEGTGSDTADDVGTNNLTGTAIEWVSNVPTKKRSAASGRENANLTAQTQASATGSLTITDNTLLAGRDSTTTITMTDWTVMAGGNFNILGMITLTEGVDFTAETSNEVTATNFAAAFDAAAGGPVTTVVGAAVTVALGGEDNGGTIIWSGTGVSPTTATLTGGIDKYQFLINGAGFTFPDDITVGATAADTIEAMRVAVLAYGPLGVNLVANGNVLEITADTPGTDGNAITLEVRASGGGSIEDDLVASGPTLTGGLEPITARSRSLVT